MAHQPVEAPFRELDENAALRAILEGTATVTGSAFFEALVKNLAEALGTYGAWVTEYLSDTQRLRALAFWLDGGFLEHWETGIEGTPCQQVVEGARLVHHPNNVLELYPVDPDLVAVNAVSYMGVPLLDVDGEVMGHLAVLDTRPMPEEPRAYALFRIFAARAAAELQRIRREQALEEREEQLALLVDSAMDAIIELDTDLSVCRYNLAAEKAFGLPNGEALGRSFAQFVTAESHARLQSLQDTLATQPKDEQYLWIPGGLEGMRGDGTTFPAEATLARYETRRAVRYVLILRNVNDRIEAEKRIQLLSDERAYLREEIKARHNFDEIIGRSAPLLEVLRDIEQVAATDATVLILGETGTGKELIARAIHARSPRRDRPLVKVNCAAIPSSLMESEFFGHEKGAFTGATARRDGRFLLADGGVIFLDEVGELPLELQAKLLRVLQEGEFEAVGASKTRKVDVRVIAATNVDLAQAVKEGRFREDLYYRLNVFPLRMPPLRERRDDIPLLAEAFIRRFSKRMGRDVAPLTPACIERLKAYTWPGNVRELENVIERALITAVGGRLNLARALPDTGVPEDCGGAGPDQAVTADAPGPIRTVQEMQELERANIIRALEATGWRVAGAQGAAARLGMNASTLNSRMRALGITRPAP